MEDKNMAIIYERDLRTFHLKTKNTSYIIKVLETNHLSQLYWGKRINTNNLDYLVEKNLWGSFLANTDNIRTFQLEATAQEYPFYGATDLRSPAIELQFEDGTTTTDLRYEGYKIFKGKAPLKGLPATYVENDGEAETLEIYLIDKLKSVKVILTYTVFEDFDAITKSVKIINESNSKVNILRALSANVDFKEDDFDFIHLSGAWARERHIVRTGLRPGTQSVESRRGASSHAQNPLWH
jgi:Alpha-galactosidase